MAYYVDLFSRETLARFVQSDQTVTGFRLRHRRVAERVRPGDKFICYLTKASMWVAILEVVDGPFEDHSPRFADEDDPFVIRFRVRPLVMLSEERGLPIKDEKVWRTLSFTRDHDPSTSTWTGRLRGSLNRLDDVDGEYLEAMLRDRASVGGESTAVVSDGSVAEPDQVEPDVGGSPEPTVAAEAEVRESILMQAKLAEIGAGMQGKMGVWIPATDRGRVRQNMPRGDKSLLSRLPLNYDQNTKNTIEQIDALWLRGPSIVRAFEVEHTTAIYSGLLRMADLLALQPNMDIRLHIVAPSRRRSKVMDEIRRPAFNIEQFGLRERCTFLSYESVDSLHEDANLPYLTPDVLERYEERAVD